MKNDVAIVGLGYVGITLAVVLAKKGLRVLGIDISRDVVDSLSRGEPHLFEPGVEELLRKHSKKSLFFQDSYPEELPGAVIICVSTPVDLDTQKPCLENLARAVADISKHLRDDSLVVVRSTVPVGSSRKIVMPLLLNSKKSFKLAFCPERTIQGKALQELQELPQIIGGLNEESSQAAEEFFRKTTPLSVRVSSLEAAEMIKLINNCHTDLIYGYGNEVALMAEKHGLDPVELITCANMNYPRPPLNLPGFVGGGCLTKDPYLLMSSFSSFRYTPGLVRSARSLNETMPVYMADKVLSSLERQHKNIAKAKIFVAGFAYKGKPLTDDTRGSPAPPFIARLKKQAGAVYGHDFLVPQKRIKDMGAIPSTIERGFRGADCVVFLNNHPDYKNLDIVSLVATMNRPALLFDCWRLFDPLHVGKIDGLVYGSIGFGG